MSSLDVTVGIIGAGSMGSAIARGLVASGALPAASLGLADTNDAVRATLSSEGFTLFESAENLVSQPYDVVLLALKPQILPQVVKEFAPALADRLVVSIAAGVPLENLEALLPTSRVVRVMPNLPIQVRSGASAICAGTKASAEDTKLVQALFAQLGAACVMREDQLDVAGALSGCGPAYFALFADQLVRAGVAAGLTAGDARELALYSMRGVATQLLESGEHMRAYMDKVTSPGGTTAAALRVMEPLTFDACFEAVEAALKRTRELAG